MSTQIEQIRDQVKQVLERANSDNTYFEQLKSDPAGTLEAAGVPMEATSHLVAELTNEDEVSGYLRCDWITCITTHCAYWSIPATNY